MRVPGWITVVAVGAAFASSACKEKGSAENVLATVGGQQVTQTEFDAFLALKGIPAADDARRDKALDAYLEREALARAIEASGKIEAARLQAEVDEFRRQVLISRYFDAILDEKVTADAVKNYYESHSKDYERRQVHVAHVLVRTNRQMSPEERAAKLTATREVQSKLQAGEDFAEVARSLSDDAVSGKKGGDLGWISEGSVDPAFSKQAFSMKVGEVSGPVETQFGFHLIKLLEAPRDAKRAFSEVAGDIRYKLRAEAKKAEVERLEGLRPIEKRSPYALAGRGGDGKASELASASDPGEAETAPNKGAN